MESEAGEPLPVRQSFLHAKSALASLTHYLHKHLHTHIPLIAKQVHIHLKLFPSTQP